MFKKYLLVACSEISIRRRSALFLLWRQDLLLEWSKNKLLNGETNNINALFQKINTSGSTYGVKQSLPVQRAVESFKRNDVCNNCKAKQRQV